MDETVKPALVSEPAMGNKLNAVSHLQIERDWKGLKEMVITANKISSRQVFLLLAEEPVLYFIKSHKFKKETAVCGILKHWQQTIT